MKTRSLLAILALTLGASASLQAQTTLRFSGAITLDKLIKPLAGEIGAAHHVAIELAPNGTGRGLEEIVTGKASAAMFAGDLTYFADLLNSAKPGSIDVAKLKTFPLFTIKSVLIVHPTNKVEALTVAQIKAIFGGQVTNWKEVGGADLPVIVALPNTSDGIRAVYASSVMKGTPFVGSARQLQTAADLNKIVAQVPAAVAFVSEKNSASGVKVVSPVEPILVPYAILTVGEPTEPLKSVITDLQIRLK